MSLAGSESSRWLVWALSALLGWQAGARAQGLDRVGPALGGELKLAFPVAEEVARGGRREIGVRLSRTGVWFEAAASRPSGKERQTRFSSRLYLSAGLALTAGLAAWWSREEADQAYARYLRSASHRRQEKEFARAERYDRIAGLSFAGMEVGLGLTTYLLFFGSTD